MNLFKRESTLKEQKLRCQEHDYCAITIPSNPTLKFTKFNFRNRLPFVMYADFESICKNI
jgi:hypothetical protein